MAEATKLELSMEICSEAPEFALDWPSDITLWINGVEVRLGVKADARNVGGLNLFGRKFGNYGQDILMRTKYAFRAGERAYELK
jgi:predicted transcriptional regulator